MGVGKTISKRGQNPSFVGVNVQNRNLLHVLMLKKKENSVSQEVAPAPLAPLFRRLSTLGRPYAQTVAKNKKSIKC